MSKQRKNYYYNNISAELDIELYDLLLTNVNKILFDYSDHHLSNKPTFKMLLKKLIMNKFFLSLYFKNILNKSHKGENIILNNAYISIHKQDSVTMLPPWVFSSGKSTFCSWKLTVIIKEINDSFGKNSIKILLSSDFKKLINAFQKELSLLFMSNKIEALIVPNDLSFFENLSIKVASKVGVPSFVYLHGLPARYNNIDDNRADYLIVWGAGLKKLYVESGVSEDKILTMQHPVYSSFEELNLQSELKNVLVLTKAISATPCISSQLVLPNRSVLLLYTEFVKENLKKLGVEKATLRLHPSEDATFYIKNMTDDFFTIDLFSKEESLAKASLVLGPTSTMVLDAIKCNKNYILFDPIFDGLTLEGMPLVAPFTGESFIKLSNSYDEMVYNIKNPGNNIDFKKLNDFLKVDTADEEKFLNILNRTYN